MIKSAQLKITAHPLDIFPVFRRWAPSCWRNILYTGLWNTALALVLALTISSFFESRHPLSTHLFHNFIVTQIVGYLIHFSLSTVTYLSNDWPNRKGGLHRTVYLVSLISVCVVVGISLGSALINGKNPFQYYLRLDTIISLSPFVAIMTVFMVVVLLMGERRHQIETRTAKQNEQLAETARMLAEAKLQALQAQIEPHFLYNTLANVLSLIETKPSLAHHMLERFIAYLRASLLASRASESTLGAEADLISAYLDVLAVRMGDRLKYEINIDTSLRAFKIAPMLLQPLIENAIHHGLEPKLEGGKIQLHAVLDNEHVMIEISDTGCGLGGLGGLGASTVSQKPGGGVGMSNLRDRLMSLYSGKARVQLIENQPCGLIVRLYLPLNFCL